MADLTSTITVSGTVGNKSISFTHTYTLEDVIDAGAVYGSAKKAIAGATADGQAGLDITFRPATLDYVFVNNVGPYPALGVFENYTGFTQQSLLLMSGQFIIAASVDGGIFTSSATATTAAGDACEAANGNKWSAIAFTPTVSVMTATLAAS